MGGRSCSFRTVKAHELAAMSSAAHVQQSIRSGSSCSALLHGDHDVPLCQCAGYVSPPTYLPPLPLKLGPSTAMPSGNRRPPPFPAASPAAAARPPPPVPAQRQPPPPVPAQEQPAPPAPAKGLPPPPVSAARVILVPKPVAAVPPGGVSSATVAPATTPYPGCTR